MDQGCLFCKFVSKEIPQEFILETDTVLAFLDINPRAPVHILIIPKKHFASLNDIKEEDKSILGDLLLAVKEVAASQGLSESGYRTVINSNAHAGQVVAHLHIHVMGGRPLGLMVAK